MTTGNTERRSHQRYELSLIGSSLLKPQDISAALTGLPKGFDSGAVVRGLSAGGAQPVATGESVKALEPLQYHLWESGIRTLIREQTDRRKPAPFAVRMVREVRRMLGQVELPTAEQGESHV